MSGPLESAENRYKEILEKFFASKYDEKSLPSHGIGHHRRVWKHARNLAPVLTGYKGNYHPSLPSSLIIASYLHDIGMCVDPGIIHGHHSSELCRQFLSENKLHEADFPGLLKAIQNHDNKNYTENASEDDLFALLSVSDDLDAFGFIGIFRYFEIYTVRGIELGQISEAIRENALKRFNHFSTIFSFDAFLVRNHQKRYEVLDEFFSGMHKQLTGKKSADRDYSGIIGTLNKMMSEQKEVSLVINENTKSDDPSLRWFFTGLSEEI